MPDERACFLRSCGRRRSTRDVDDNKHDDHDDHNAYERCDGPIPLMVDLAFRMDLADARMGLWCLRVKGISRC